MQHNNNPLTPHLQIYRWQISSLLSIAHRIIGVINIAAISLICFWVMSLSFGEATYEITKIFFQSFFGKFLIILGGSQDLTYANYLGYEKQEQIVNLVSIDNEIDISTNDDLISKNGPYKKLSNLQSFS